MSARELDLGYAPVLALRVTYLGELGYELHVPVEYALAALRAAVGGRRAVRHRQRRLPRDQQPAAREALPRLGLRPHAGLQSVRGGARLLRRARQGRVSRPRGARRGQGERTEAEAHVVRRAAGAEPLRRRDRHSPATACWAASRAAATATRSAAISFARTSPPASRSRATTGSRSWANGIPRFVTRGRCTIPIVARSLPERRVDATGDTHAGPHCHAGSRARGAARHAPRRPRHAARVLSRRRAVRRRNAHDLARRLAVRRIRLRDSESRRLPDARASTDRRCW